ncbi:vanomycin resistance protein VanB [Cellulomonas bogoriensis 69B4 = DSM 16987]|uniref:Vanomycin resistance protein VanB n=1 Tax=Cellulomonas bogoriensis 69B4 = DSM 16987 TaxID=1386082 RepID=A0A0A0BL08_9CELL|nr:vanomycin resistance protein VanB [Cellulomonas bogoriensis 69B4 = DSM 16987]
MQPGGETGPEPAALPRSPMDEFEDETARSTPWARTLGLVAAAVVVVAGVYVGAAWWWSDRVPPGSTVAGVEVGGLTAEEARAHLRSELGGVVTQPVAVEAGEKRTTLDPVEAGLELDVEATLGPVTGFGLEPWRLWQQVFGGGPVAPVTQVDDDALDAAVEALSGALATEPLDGTISFVDARPVPEDSAEGIDLDVDSTRQIVIEQWLTAAPPLQLPTVVVPPVIDDAEVERAMRELARPLSRAPVTVVVDDQRAELPVEVVTGAAGFTGENGRLELQLDGEALTEAVLDRTDDLLTDAEDARFEFEDGEPVIVPGTPGTTLDPEVMVDAVTVAGTGDDRTARVDLVEVDPEATTAELEGLGVVERVGEFSTPLTADSNRNHNLTLGASRVNGTLLRPDEVFSLNDTLAPITTESGYRQAGVVVNGVLQQGTGGGLSQMGTTVYNAAFFAGLEDVEHQPHSFYFSRYPEGREATIYAGVLDVKVGNNTPYGVLFQSWVAGGRLHVALWSTEYWEVEHWTSGRSNVVSPTTVYNTESGCIAQAAGNPGFTVTVGRRLLREGETRHEESNTWTYRPQNAIVCGPPPGSRTDDDEDDEDDEDDD